MRWRATSDLAAGEGRWPACARGDDGSVVAADILPRFKMRWEKRESKNTHLNVLCRAVVARSLGAYKAGVIGGEGCSVGGCSEVACVRTRERRQCCGRQFPAPVREMSWKKKRKAKNTHLNVL